MKQILSYIVKMLCLNSCLISACLAVNASRAAVQKEENPKPSSLHLAGVMIPENASAAVAVLTNTQTGKTFVLKQGETLFDVQLVRVFEDRVIVRRGGEAFQIFFGEIPPSPFQEKQNQKTPPHSEPPPLQTYNKNFTRAEVLKILHTEFPRIIKEIQVTPHIVDGKVRGFQITRLPQTSFLSAEEICENDIIKEINGIRLDGFSTLFSLPDRFKNDKQLDLQIERKGKLVRLVVNLNEVP